METVGFGDLYHLKLGFLPSSMAYTMPGYDCWGTHFAWAAAVALPLRLQNGVSTSLSCDFQMHLSLALEAWRFGRDVAG